MAQETVKAVRSGVIKTIEIYTLVKKERNTNAISMNEGMREVFR